MPVDNPRKIHSDEMIAFMEELSAHNRALKALGALLESVDFQKYFINHDNAALYRSGLNRIITLYLDHQERILHKLHTAFTREPES